MTLYQTIYGYHNRSYYEGIMSTIRSASTEHPRTLVLRVDLHDPVIIEQGDMITCFHNHHPGTMNRFINSLNAKLAAYQQRTAQSGKRVYPNTLRYAWVREFSKTGKRHFHALLLFNKDAFFHLGDYDLENSTLRTMITTAWCSALGDPPELGRDWVQYPDDGRYTLHKRDVDRDIYPEDLIDRIHYMTKVRSKSTHDGCRNFGCSRI
ncbi:TPA: inovirus Gp2 family protein [Aeromonas veronii]|uniref:inovirus Gp2 family protein n=1 Tax=Aeromonas veronii TaxID=654 RepID=UPI003309DD4A|nr:inovirus Gp2 family protein [Aeromonas veronii]HDO1336262.1 inovirus Gp2 family protein [Aeromonas veronii]HDO1340783.1 inovirus Gp2 family protein [Aeromonas veronii]HDO1345310.1 inovirus Gp2 family protein [Aeromonas veronii]HDO1349885.1 inovirus Gp2 family protein [Aeromonas veronii]